MFADALATLAATTSAGIDPQSPMEVVGKSVQYFWSQLS